MELASAVSLGDNPHFRKLGGLGALVERAGQPPRIVVARVGVPSEQAVAVVDIDLDDASDIVVSAVWSAATRLDSVPAQTVALGCQASGCRLFGAAAGESSLIRLQGLDLPTNANVDSLVAGVRASEGTISVKDTLCAYGEGLYCVDSSGWREVLPAKRSGTLTRVALGRPSVAVSKLGEVFVEDSGTWVSRSLPFSNVTSLTAELGIVSVVGPEGALYLRSAPLGEAQCQPSVPLLIAWPGFGTSGEPWLVLTQMGTAYRQTSMSNDWCAVSAGVPNLVAATVSRCGASDNILAISDSALFSILGPLSCNAS